MSLQLASFTLILGTFYFDTGSALFHAFLLRCALADSWDQISLKSRFFYSPQAFRFFLSLRQMHGCYVSIVFSWLWFRLCLWWLLHWWLSLKTENHSCCFALLTETKMLKNSKAMTEFQQMNSNVIGSMGAMLTAKSLHYACVTPFSSFSYVSLHSLLINSQPLAGF